MARFRDSADRDWALAIAIGHVGELKREAGFDLGAPAKDSTAFAEALFGDPMTIALVLWVLIRKQAGPLTQEEFFAALDPEAVDRATDALLEAITDFTLRRRSQPVKAKLPELMAAVDKRFASQVETAFASTLKKLAGDSPESSAPTPAG